MVRNLEATASCMQLMAPQQISQRTLATFERQVDDAITQKAESVGLNLSAVQIIDSHGLNWLLGTLARLTTCGIQMHLVNPSPIMNDVLLSTRLDARFTIHRSPGDGANHG